MQDEFINAAGFLYVSTIEKTVLGASISTPDTLQFVLEHMKPEYFYDKLHADIMQVLVDISNEAKQPDMLIVVERLRKKKSLASSGLAYIADMSSSYYVMKSQLVEHCNIIKEYYFRRRVVEINQKYALAQMEQETDPVTSYNDQQAELLALMQELKTEKASTLSASVDEIRKKISDAAAGIVPVDIMATGIKSLDNVIMGFFPTDLVLIGARPSMGKTALVLSIIAHLCKQGKGVRIYSLEMSAAQLIARLVSIVSGVSYEHVKRARVTADQKAKMDEALDIISKWKLYIDDRAGISITTLRATSIQDAASGKEVDMIVVDYIQLMDVGKNASNRNVGVGIASTALKILAKDLQVPVIALSQLSRSLEARPSKRPVLADLRDSGSLEQDADMVIFLYRPEQYGLTSYDDNNSTIGVAELNVAKNRNGELGLAMAKFTKETTTFSDLEESALAAYYENDEADENPF